MPQMIMKMEYSGGILNFKKCSVISFCDKWVPVTMAWHVLSLQMEEQPPIWRAAANILNKQSWIADKG